MGLDMYLTTAIDDINIISWRKANAIHKYFVDLDGGRDECQEIKVSGKQLKELIDICKEVLQDNSKAKELLPTQSGFFFGNTDYNENYFDIIKETINTLSSFTFDDDVEFIYQASW